MRILLYSEYWETRGGGERYLLNVAEALVKQGHRVTAVVPPMFNMEALLKYFNIDLPSNLVTVNAQDRETAERMSTLYDLTIITTNCRYFNYRSPKAIFILQTPHGKTWGWNHRRWMETYGRNQMFSRFQSENVVVYSHFVAESVKGLYGVDATVIEPCVDEFQPGEKKKVILSVGRIFRGPENDKRYDVLIEAFRKFSKTHPDWEYRIVGGCNDFSYLLKLEKQAYGLPIQFFINVKYDTIAEHYAEAFMFWYATGYGINQKKYPEKCEHFGIATAEAMSAGCLPLVFSAGGSKEIVPHRRWTTIEQLCEWSGALAKMYGDVDHKLEGYSARQYFKPAFQSKWENYMREHD